MAEKDFAILKSESELINFNEFLIKTNKQVSSFTMIHSEFKENGDYYYYTNCHYKNKLFVDFYPVR